MASKSIDADIIRELAGLLTETDLNEIEIEQNGFRIRVARGGAMSNTIHAPVAVSAPQAAPVPAAGAVAETDHSTNAVTSPMVGTVYLSPEPGAPVFVNVSDKVTEGQTLFIVEAMKVMNAIPSPRSGTVTQILATDGQPVEYGEPLVVIE